MADRTLQPKVYDPQMVPEVVCDGPMNVHWIGNRGIITFTHPRARSQPLFEGETQIDLIVRARIATSVQNLVALRDLLARLLPADKPAVETPVRGGTTPKLH
jgi:hypothetical protein